ncbi:hypothetical protein PC123_g9282 [Phytophthora cactorum]|nr:hypothetical protein PC123_g9282 [Phytophthora cactorum]
MISLGVKFVIRSNASATDVFTVRVENRMEGVFLAIP